MKQTSYRNFRGVYRAPSCLRWLTSRERSILRLRVLQVSSDLFSRDIKVVY